MKKVTLDDLVVPTTGEIGESLQRAVGEPVQCLLVCSQPDTDHLHVGIFNLTKEELKLILLSLIQEVADPEDEIVQVIQPVQS